MVKTQDFFTAFCLEAIGGFFIVYVYYKLIIEKNSFEFAGGIGLGGVYLFLTIFTMNKTGACFNVFRPVASMILIRPDFNISFYLGSLAGGLLGGILGSIELSESPLEI